MVQMPIQSPQDLLLHELHGIEDAESEASRALESQLEEVENSQLQKLLQRRLQQGERLLKEVQKNLEKLNGQGGGRENEAARGLIRDAEQLLQEVQSPEMKEAVLIAGVQKLEHYCIAVWGTVKAMAQEIGEQELARTMERALKEGYKLDEELTRLAESRINPAALEAGEEDEEEDEDEDEFEDEEEGEDEDEDEEEEEGEEGEEAGSQQQASQSGQPSKSSGSQAKSGGSKESKSGGPQSSKSGGSQKKSAGGKASKGGASSDLKSREYRDKDGNVRHHTREYMNRRGED
jgi:ferritin-like metal-binding protein YciE